MSEPSDAPTAADALPPGFYERVAPFLHICGMGCLQFFSRPDDPLPQEITELTGLDMAGSRMITAINSNETLARQLLEEPALFYVYLLVGCQVLEGPLAEPVMHFLQDHGHFDAEQLEELRTRLLPFGASFVELVGKFAANDDEETREDLHLLRLQIEGAFVRLSDTLHPVEVPAAAAETAEADEADDAAADDEEEDEDWEDEDDEFIFEVRFREEQLHMLRLAVILARMMPHYPELPFAQAAAQLSGCTPEAIASLTPRLQAATPAELTQLSWHDVALLYQCTQVLAMVLVSPLMDTLHLTGPLHDEPEDDADEAAEDVAASAALKEDEVTETPDEADDEPALTREERVQRRQEIICLMISGFVACIQENFADEPRLEELRQEVEALADLL